MKTYIKLSLVIVAVLFAWPSMSQSKRDIGGKVSRPEPTAPQKWAVIIGVGDYEDSGMTDLPKAVNDARAVKEMLVSVPDGFPEKNVILLADTEGENRAPTRANMMRYLKSQLALTSEQDTLLVYFAGHGTTEDGALYLIPSDAALGEVKFTGFPFAELETRIQKARAKKKILILDACHSGSGRGTDNMSKVALVELERASEGMVVLSSCGAEELSHDMPETDHGAFTYFLLQGLSGKADNDKSGYITASELSLFTWDATRRWAAEHGLTQTPWRMEKVAGELVLAKVGGIVPTLKPTSALAKPETPTPPPIMLGHLQVAVNAPNASVSVNGEKKGTASLTKALKIESLPVGTATVEVSAEGYKLASKTVEIKRGEWTQETFELAKAQAGDTRTFDGIEFVWIPPGSFMMGSNDGSSDEEPIHRVTISKGFWMSKYEVTQRQWQSVMGSYPWKFTGDSLPVDRLSWHACLGFVQKLNSRSDGKYRLPTEAEWEYACRAGSTAVYSFGDSESSLGDYAWHSSNSGRKTHSVGGKKPNAWGLYDMHGNVWEWCLDWYDKDYYDYSPGTDPKGPSSGKYYRVSRGGPWGGSPKYLRSARRERGRVALPGKVALPGYASGVRIVRTP